MAPRTNSLLSVRAPHADPSPPAKLSGLWCKPASIDTMRGNLLFFCCKRTREILSCKRRPIKKPPFASPEQGGNGCREFFGKFHDRKIRKRTLGCRSHQRLKVFSFYPTGFCIAQTEVEQFWSNFKMPQVLETYIQKPTKKPSICSD